MAHDVFICYASTDKPVADAACAALEQRNIRCWIAPRDVIPGRDYAEAITEAIHQAGVIVLVFSQSANTSPHVRRELERAVDKGRAILPIRVDESVPSASLEYYISGVHWLDALTPPLAAHLGRLGDAVEFMLAIPPPELERMEPEPSPPIAGGQQSHPIDADAEAVRFTARPTAIQPPRISKRLLAVAALVAGAAALLLLLFANASATKKTKPPRPTTTTLGASATTTSNVGIATTALPVGPQKYTITADCGNANCKIELFAAPWDEQRIVVAGNVKNGDEVLIECFRRGETAENPDTGQSSDVWLKLQGADQYATAMYAVGPPVPPC